MNRLDGKVAIVVGGGTGIGLGCAKALAEEGAKVVIAGRRESVLRDAVKQLEGAGPIFMHVVDVVSRQSVSDLIDWAEREVGDINILVNAAGINVPDRSMARMEPEQWDDVMAINATGAYNCMYAVLPGMRERQEGLIVNISSISGLRPLTLGGVAYCSAKFAMTALGTTVGNEVNKDGIRVTTIYPGEVNTPIMDLRPNPPSAEHRARILQWEDIGPVVAMIAALPPHVHIPDLTIKPLSQDLE